MTASRAFTNQHLANRPSPQASSGGCSAQRSKAYGHRSRKRQPVGHANADGTCPGIAGSGRPRVAADGMALSSASA
jgi:hypothetical protein